MLVEQRQTRAWVRHRAYMSGLAGGFAVAGIVAGVLAWAMNPGVLDGVMVAKILSVTFIGVAGVLGLAHWGTR